MKKNLSGIYLLAALFIAGFTLSACGGDDEDGQQPQKTTEASSGTNSGNGNGNGAGEGTGSGEGDEAGTYTPHDLEIIEQNFPDEEFRKYLLAQSYGSDGMITVEEQAGITAIRVETYKLKSLKGIEYFTALTSLRCANCSLTELNVTRHTALTELYCNGNYLRALDLSHNTALTALYCQSNTSLSALDVTKNTLLTILYCDNTLLTELDVTKNTALIELSCGNNKLTDLDVTGLTKLTKLQCGPNKLTALDVTKNTALTELRCSRNQLTELDVSKCSKLELLMCGTNQLTALDVSGNTALSQLDCENNQLASLKVSNKVGYLNCPMNRLKGAAMDELLAGLQTRRTAQSWNIIYNGNEENEMTTAQVATATAKGWIPYCWNGSTWQRYEGCDQ